MKIKRKWAAGIGVALSVGAVFWGRELASWRPVTLGKVGFAPTQLKFSRDGRFLLTEDALQGKGVIIDLKTAAVDSNSSHIRDFGKTHGLETFPRLSFDERSERVIFRISPQKQVVLHDLGIGRDIVGIENGRSARYGWSKSRREVFAGFMGEIYIWNWDDGKLKRRVRFAERDDNQFAFSPDGKWLLALETKDRLRFLGRFDMQTGELVQRLLENPLENPQLNSLGFSPDGRYFGYTSWDIGSRAYESKIYGAQDWKWRWEWESGKKIYWVFPDRIGLVRPDHFEWRDTSGEVLQSLRGPFGEISDWALSPDGNWIYSAEQSGIIRKWRAR